MYVYVLHLLLLVWLVLMCLGALCACECVLFFNTISWFSLTVTAFILYLLEKKQFK